MHLKEFDAPKVKIIRFDIQDILTASGGETNPTGPIDPELPPDDDF